MLRELVVGVSRCMEIPDESGVQESMELAIYTALLAGIETEGLAQAEQLSRHARVEPQEPGSPA